MKIWAIVPARAGSKGIKNKNIRRLAGLELFMWPVRAATRSGVFEKIIVSTDMKEIKHLTSPAFMVKKRPKELSTGYPGSIIDVVHDLLSGYSRLPEYFALMQPTSPFVSVEHIKTCWERLKKSKADSIQTITPVSHHNHAYNQRIVEKDKVSFAFPKTRAAQGKQAQPTHYSLGNLIMTKTEYFMEEKDFFGKSLFEIIPNDYCVDIDFEEDFKEAERIYYTKRLQL